MKSHIFIAPGLSLALFVCLTCLAPKGACAWDGFDADTAELVAITPDAPPQKGDSVTVKNYDRNSETQAIVVSVTRNKRTIEVVARYPDNSERTLVMEGR